MSIFDEITLRDIFAAACLPECKLACYNEKEYALRAFAAYRQADFMLAERTRISSLRGEDIAIGESITRPATGKDKKPVAGRVSSFANAADDSK